MRVEVSFISSIPLPLSLIFAHFRYLHPVFLQRDIAGTELMVSIMLFAIRLQNGLTATFSNSAAKTTDLTGLTMDLGILTSMVNEKEYRNARNSATR